MNANRNSIEDLARKLMRLLERRVIYEHEAVFKLLDDVAWDITQFGLSDQIDQLLEIIPTLPASAQAEIQKFVCGSDDLIFCRNVLCDPGENPPEDWRHPPTQQRADVDYSTDPISIVIHCSDGTSFSLPPNDSYRNIVFAVRNHFAQNLNDTQNAE